MLNKIGLETSSNINKADNFNKYLKSHYFTVKIYQILKFCDIVELWKMNTKKLPSNTFHGSFIANQTFVYPSFSTGMLSFTYIKNW